MQNVLQALCQAKPWLFDSVFIIYKLLVGLEKQHVLRVYQAANAGEQQIALHQCTQ